MGVQEEGNVGAWEGTWGYRSESEVTWDRGLEGKWRHRNKSGGIAGKVRGWGKGRRQEGRWGDWRKGESEEGGDQIGSGKVGMVVGLTAHDLRVGGNATAVGGGEG